MKRWLLFPVMFVLCMLLGGCAVQQTKQLSPESLQFSFANPAVLTVGEQTYSCVLRRTDLSRSFCRFSRGQSAVSFGRPIGLQSVLHQFNAGGRNTIYRGISRAILYVDRKCRRESSTAFHGARGYCGISSRTRWPQRNSILLK